MGPDRGNSITRFELPGDVAGMGLGVHASNGTPSAVSDICRRDEVNMLDCGAPIEVIAGRGSPHGCRTPLSASPVAQVTATIAVLIQGWPEMD
jgi:hypothetical protein